MNGGLLYIYDFHLHFTTSTETYLLKSALQMIQRRGGGDFWLNGILKIISHHHNFEVQVTLIFLQSSRPFFALSFNLKGIWNEMEKNWSTFNLMTK